MDVIKRLSVFKSFVIELIQEIKSQIQLRVSATIWNQVKEAFTGTAFELFEKLDEFVEELKDNQYYDVTGSIQASKQDADTHKDWRQ